MLKQIVDAFSYNPRLIWMRERFFPNALTQMDTLRRAANYRLRMWTIPDKLHIAIPGYDTYEMQVPVAGNSYFWGYQFAVVSAVNPAGDPAETTASDILAKATDDCTQIPLFQDFVSGGGIRTAGTAGFQPILLTQPRVILDPGLVNVELTNRTANTITCQLLLLFAEPCKVITEETREVDWRLATMRTP